MNDVSAHVFIVEACAGSGKTYILAKRYISLITESSQTAEKIPINNILAITFTNKAAIEMKERILEFLKKMAFNSSREADSAMDYIIKNYNFFQVQTIDSFINTILSGCAFRLGLSANFEIKRYYKDYIARSLDNIIDKAHDDKRIMKIFRNFLGQYLYIDTKSGWLLKQDILKVAESLFAENNKYKGSFVRTKTDIKDLFSVKEETFGLITALNNTLPQETNAGFTKALSNFLARNSVNFNIDKLSDFFNREEFPVNKGGSMPAKVEKLWKNIRKNICNIAELEASSTYNYYIDIFNILYEEFKFLSGKDDVLFLEQLNKQARSLFDEKAITVPELYYRLAAGFRHFLIDEFQDTSLLQWKNIFPMVLDALAAGGSLFCVGDKKQAIYRFKGGEPSLVDSVKTDLPAFGVEVSSLNRNYRTRSNIVEFNNKIFSEENIKRFVSSKGLSQLDLDEISGIFASSAQESREDFKGGYVCVESVAPDSNETSDEAIKNKLINLIKELNKRFDYKDIAVLVRKNDEVKMLTAWLLENNIPVESEKTLNIRENLYIKELISFLRFLDSPTDNLFFASFILGEIFTKSAGVRQEDMQDFIFSACPHNKKEKTVYLYIEFRKKFPAIWEKFIEDFFKNVGIAPLYEFVVSIFGRYNCLVNFAGYQGFFMKFLELIKTQETDRQGLASFLDYFDTVPDDDLYVHAYQTDSVKITTVHKSKGLGFGVVIVPFTQINIKIDTAVTVAQGDNFHYMYIKKRYADFSPVLAKVYSQQYKKALIDELNNIYVAFTRPKDELYIFMPKPKDTLIPYENLQTGIKQKKEKNSASQLVNYIPASEYKDWIQFLKDEFIDMDQAVNKKKALKGDVLHFILSFIGNLKGSAVGARHAVPLLNKAIEAARVKFPVISDFSEFQAKIEALISDKKFKEFFFLDDGVVYQEKEAVDFYGDTKRIDRLIVKEKEVLIIDYKSSKDKEDEYLKQLAGYKNIISSIYPKKTVKGFLIYLEDLTMTLSP